MELSRKILPKSLELWFFSVCSFYCISCWGVELSSNINSLYLRKTDQKCSCQEQLKSYTKDISNKKYSSGIWSTLYGNNYQYNIIHCDASKKQALSGVKVMIYTLLLKKIVLMWSHCAHRPFRWLFNTITWPNNMPQHKTVDKKAAKKPAGKPHLKEEKKPMGSVWL